jgi:hypothetical protein
MRRCAQCQSPNPDSAAFCLACGTALAPLRRRPWISAADLWDRPSFKRVALGLLPLVLFALSFGRLLTVGDLRREWRFLLFHELHGLILGLGLAWAWQERPSGWGRWALVGLFGGLVAEALDAWYSYHGLMGSVSLALWQWGGMAEDRALVYEILQILRLAAPGLALWALAYAPKPGLGIQRVLALAWLVLALALRSQVRGAWVSWGALETALGWAQLGLYTLSVLALGWGLGPRGLTRGTEIH